VPSYRADNGRLLFALQETPGAPQLAGQYGEIPITCETCIRALQRGGAFWVEPDRHEVQLEVKRVLTTPRTQ